jgi:hypothetical protein
MKPNLEELCIEQLWKIEEDQAMNVDLMASRIKFPRTSTASALLRLEKRGICGSFKEKGLNGNCFSKDARKKNLKYYFLTDEYRAHNGK